MTQSPSLLPLALDERGCKTPLDDLVQSALCEMATGRWSMLLQEIGDFGASMRRGPEEAREIARRALSAVPASQAVAVKALDLSNLLKHAFLSGVVAARNLPAGSECDGPSLWVGYDPNGNHAYRRIRSALIAQEPAEGAATTHDGFSARENLHQALDECALPSKEEWEAARDVVARAALTDSPAPAKRKPLSEYRQAGQCNCSVCLNIRRDADEQRNPAPAKPEGAVNAELLAAGQFLLDRLDDFGIPDEEAREWIGHVEPALARFRAALSAPSPREGWVTVPKEPTEEMLKAGLYADAFKRDEIHAYEDPENVYRAMLSAAPSPQGREGQS